MASPQAVAGELEAIGVVDDAVEDGVGDITGDLKAKQVHVAYRSEVIAPGDIETAINRLGYRVKEVHHQAA